MPKIKLQRALGGVGGAITGADGGGELDGEGGVIGSAMPSFYRMSGQKQGRVGQDRQQLSRRSVCFDPSDERDANEMDCFDIVQRDDQDTSLMR